MPTATTDYRAIYDGVMATNPGYSDAAHSPGYKACLVEADRIRSAGGPVLDVGCGKGFAVELLRGPMFAAEAWGVDVSPVAVEAGNARMMERLGIAPLQLMEPGHLPHASGRFGLVTCFDVLEHLDEPDLIPLRDGIRRVLQPGGLLICTASTRPAASVDHHGENLHRTVRAAGWWADLMEADEYRWHRRTQDAVLVWRRPS